MKASKLNNQYTKLFNLEVLPGEPPEIHFFKKYRTFGFQTIVNRYVSSTMFKNLFPGLKTLSLAILEHFFVLIILFGHGLANCFLFDPLTYTSLGGCYVYLSVDVLGTCSVHASKDFQLFFFELLVLGQVRGL